MRTLWWLLLSFTFTSKFNESQLNGHYIEKVSCSDVTFRFFKDLFITGVYVSFTDLTRMDRTCNSCVLPLVEDDYDDYSTGVRSLMHAAYKGNVQCVEELIAAGADVNAEDEDGFTLRVVTHVVKHASRHCWMKELMLTPVTRIVTRLSCGR